METETIAGEFLCRFMTTATTKYIMKTWLKKRRKQLLFQIKFWIMFQDDKAMLQDFKNGDFKEDGTVRDSRFLRRYCYTF